ncbi:uncharacterized protein LOC120356194, partial [Nilaparvata lugens]|uniref:uncharacterized protein LOC120356194 n=1 Tax=Nilaparvata lugens TaxID=108931 RepID=UPI00193DC1E2
KISVKHVKHTVPPVPTNFTNVQAKGRLIEQLDKVVNSTQRLSLDSKLNSRQKSKLNDAECQTDDLILKEKEELTARIDELLSQRDALIEEIKEMKILDSSLSLNNNDVGTQTELDTSSQSVNTQTETSYRLTTSKCKADCDSLEIVGIREQTIKILNDNNNSLHREIQEMELEIRKNYDRINTVMEENYKLRDIVSSFTNRVDELKNKRNWELKNSDHKINETQDWKRKVLIFSDSQGRDQATYLNNTLTNNFLVSGFVLGGAKISQIVDAVLRSKEVANLNDNDLVIIIGGTNDVNLNWDENYNRAFRQQICRLLALSVKTNIVIGTIPYRYDLPNSSTINSTIKNINAGLKNIARNKATVLDMWNLKACEHTRHGLHLNRRGKSVIARRLKDIIMKPRQVTVDTPDIIYERMSVSQSMKVTETNQSGEMEIPVVENRGTRNIKSFLEKGPVASIAI